MSDIQSVMVKAATAIDKGIIDVRTKKLCHYTSPDGLLGIFSQEEPSLYFSQYDSLNDTKERKDIFESLNLFCKRKLGAGKISKELYDDILAIPLSDLFGITRKTNEELILDDGKVVKVSTAMANEECYTYICSFSKNSDSLPMWRMYSKADHYEGFCIEFNSSPFEQEQYFNKGFSIELNKVIYKEREKMELLDSVLSPIIEIYDSADQDGKEKLISIVKLMISKFQFVFKNKAFSYEEEIRAVLHVPKNEINCKDKLSSRQYRQSNGLIVPYVVYSLPALSVRSITIAPTIKEEIAVTNLKDYLTSKKLSHVDIITSDIPIRNV